ncbi:MAG: hypothetical protein EA384_07930 [Spirochaetaceae bacterium]|nr:MAG: hypothetical protein EA384_07930 [Spirochaetaceae bacterium]
MPEMGFLRFTVPFLLLIMLPLPAVPHDHEQLQTPFSAAEIERFIEDWPDFVTWAGMGEAAVERGLAGRGWHTGRFYYVANQVSAGLVQLEEAERLSQAAEELEQQRAAIRQSPHLTDEQKEQMITRLGRQPAASTPAPAGEAGHAVDSAELLLIHAWRDELKRVLRIDY